MKSLSLITVLQITIACLFIIWSVLLIYSYGSEHRDILETRSQSRQLKSLDQRVQLPPDTFVDDTTTSSSVLLPDQSQTEPETTVMNDDVDSSEVITGQPTEMVPPEVTEEFESRERGDGAATTTTPEPEIIPPEVENEIASSSPSTSTTEQPENSSDLPPPSEPEEIPNVATEVTSTDQPPATESLPPITEPETTPNSVVESVSSESPETDSESSSTIRSDLEPQTTPPTMAEGSVSEETISPSPPIDASSVSEETPTTTTEISDNVSEAESPLLPTPSEPEGQLSPPTTPPSELNETSSVDPPAPEDITEVPPTAPETEAPQITEVITEATSTETSETVPDSTVTTTPTPSEGEDHGFMTEKVTITPDTETTTTEASKPSSEGLPHQGSSDKDANGQTNRPLKPAKTYTPSYNGWFYRYVPAKMGGGGSQSYWYQAQDGVGLNRIDVTHPQPDKTPTAMDIQGALERELQRRKSIQHWLLQSLYQYSNTMANEIITVSKLMQTNRLAMDQTMTSSTITEIQRLNRMLLFTNEYLQKLARFQEYDGLLSSS